MRALLRREHVTFAKKLDRLISLISNSRETIITFNAKPYECRGGTAYINPGLRTVKITFCRDVNELSEGDLIRGLLDIIAIVRLRLPAWAFTLLGILLAFTAVAQFFTNLPWFGSFALFAAFMALLQILASYSGVQARRLDRVKVMRLHGELMDYSSDYAMKFERLKNFFEEVVRNVRGRSEEGTIVGIRNIFWFKVRKRKRLIEVELSKPR